MPPHCIVFTEIWYGNFSRHVTNVTTILHDTCTGRISWRFHLLKIPRARTARGFWKPSQFCGSTLCGLRKSLGSVCSPPEVLERSWVISSLCWAQSSIRTYLTRTCLTMIAHMFVVYPCIEKIWKNDGVLGVASCCKVHKQKPICGGEYPWAAKYIWWDGMLLEIDSYTNISGKH